MKSESTRKTQLLRDLPRLQVVILYGDDPDLAHALASDLVAAAAGSVDDPFRVTLCDGDRSEPVDSALATPPLSGGRQVVWVRHASERLAACTGAALTGSPEALLVLEYPAASKRSKLRTLVEQSPRGCAVACYAQAEAVRDVVRAELGAFTVAAGEEVVARVAALAAATQRTGAQAGLLAALYAGHGGRLEAADIAALGDAGSGSEQGLASALNRGLAGDAAALDTAVGAALEESGGVGVLRSALGHLQRLRVLALQVEAGRSVAEAGRALRPPLFFREEREVAAALRAWPSARLTAALRALHIAERSVKSNGVPGDATAAASLSRLVRRAAVSRG